MFEKMFYYCYRVFCSIQRHRNLCKTRNLLCCLMFNGFPYFKIISIVYSELYLYRAGKIFLRKPWSKSSCIYTGSTGSKKTCSQRLSWFCVHFTVSLEMADSSLFLKYIWTNPCSVIRSHRSKLIYHISNFVRG